MKKTYSILIVSSTDFEIQKFIKNLLDSGFVFDSGLYVKDHLVIDVLISGIGIAQTVYRLTKKLRDTYDLVINAGICGSFTDTFLPGTCVNVTCDEFADLGMSFPNRSFKTLFDEELIHQNTHPFVNGQLKNTFRLPEGLSIAEARGITVNNCSGDLEQIQRRKEQFNADVESMEGAGVAYVCLLEGVDYLQIRAVSNKIEPRNKDNWEIGKATKQLAKCMIEIVEGLYLD